MCHLQGCLVPWCPVRRPRWTWQPADPSRTLSGKTLPASSCHEETEQPLVERRSAHYVSWNIKEIGWSGGTGVNGRGGVERRFSLMVCEVCHISGIATPCWHRWVQMAWQMSRVLTGSHSRAEHTHTLVMSRGRENSCMLLVHDSITVSELINIPRRVFNEHTLVTMDSCPYINIQIQKWFTVHLFLFYTEICILVMNFVFIFSISYTQSF